MKPQWEKKYPESNINNKERKLELVKKFTGTNKSNIGIKRIEIIEKENKKSKTNNTDIDVKQLQRELKTFKSNYRQLEKENIKFKEELKSLKITNFELKNNLTLIDEYEKQIQKLNEQIYFYDKQQRELQYKISQIEAEAVNITKEHQLRIKQLEHNNQQLREVNSGLKIKIAEGIQDNTNQCMLFDTILTVSVIEENKMLKNHLNTSISELNIYKEKYDNAMRMVNQLNQSSKMIINEKSDNEIQYGILRKDEQTKWIFFVNSNEEYYIVRNTKGLNNKIGHFVAVEIIDEQYVEVVKVYKSKEI